mgnify:CR=1 FL=1
MRTDDRLVFWGVFLFFLSLLTGLLLVAALAACGSSRVLMIGRDRVVALETPSQTCSARWLTQYIAPRGVCSTFPAPAYTCRDTRNGMSTSVNFENSPSRSTR